MPTLAIQIHRCNEFAIEDSNLPGPEGFINESKFEKVVIMEQGMTSGEPSLMFFIQLPDGKYTQVQTSGAILEMIHGALLGAKSHWKENPVPNIWKGGSEIR